MNRRGKVASSTIHLPKYCNALKIKLKSSKHHLNKLLFYKTCFILPSPLTSGMGGRTISVTGITQVTDYDVSRELDDFFVNVSSAFDAFAQVVNLVYLIPPLTPNIVKPSNVQNAMSRNFPTDKLTNHLTTLQAKPWYMDMKAFRNTIHKHPIEFIPESKRLGFMETSWDTKIMLPDDPTSTTPTYFSKREFGVFGVDIFKETLDAINIMYGLMKARIRVADCIPI